MDILFPFCIDVITSVMYRQFPFVVLLLLLSEFIEEKEKNVKSMNNRLFEWMMMMTNERRFADRYLGYVISLLDFVHHDHWNNDRHRYHSNEKQLFVKSLLLHQVIQLMLSHGLHQLQVVYHLMKISSI